MKRSLENKILAAFALLICISVVSFNSTRKSAADAALVSRTHEVQTTLAELPSTMTDIEAGQRSFTFTGDESYLLTFRTALASVNKTFLTTRQLLADNARQQERLKNLQPLLAERMATSTEIVEMRLTDGFDASMGEVKELSGLLSVRSWRNRIRDDRNFWQSVEYYLATYTDATAGHGICPSCVSKETEKRPE